MSRVEINAGGRHVVVDHDGTDLAYLIEKAMGAWKETAGATAKPGPATGFAAERRDDARYTQHGGSWQKPVRAEGDPR